MFLFDNFFAASILIHPLASILLLSLADGSLIVFQVFYSFFNSARKNASIANIKAETIIPVIKPRMNDIFLCFRIFKPTVDFWRFVFWNVFALLPSHRRQPTRLEEFFGIPIRPNSYFPKKWNNFFVKTINSFFQIRFFRRKIFMSNSFYHNFILFYYFSTPIFFLLLFPNLALYALVLFFEVGAPPCLPKGIGFSFLLG